MTLYRFASPALLAAVLLTTLCAGAQQADDVQARFLALAGSTRLKDPALKPWHLKLSFEQKATNEHPADSGIIEEWWAAPDQYRITVNSALYDGSTSRNGIIFSRTSGLDPMPAIDSDLLGLFVNPVPSAERIAKWPPTLVKRPAGKVVLDCFVLGSPNKAPVPSFGTVPTFCAQPDTPGLLVLYRWRDETVAVSRQGKFQGKVVATDLQILDSANPYLHAHVDVLETFIPKAAEFAPTGDQRKVNEALAGTPYDSPPTLRKKITPEYPKSARNAHIFGIVVLDAIIAEDGHIESLTVLHSPDPEISRAALTAVRQWQYTPETQNGQAVKVHTQISVNFNMGQD